MFLRKHNNKPIGFSIIELLIIIILIGILVAIIIPRIATRTELARQKKALADLENIAKAQEVAVVDTGYVYRLYVLDDTKGEGDGIGFGGLNDVDDAFLDEYNPSGTTYNTVFVYPERIFIEPETGAQIASGTAIDLLRGAQRNETTFGWNGPYLVTRADNGSLPFGFGTRKPSDEPDGIPDDPWGNNYLLFTRNGLMYESDNTGEIYDTLNYSYWAASPYNCKVFDRNTVLSLGKNGVPGDGSGPSSDPAAPGNFGQGDDLVIHF